MLGKTSGNGLQGDQNSASPSVTGHKSAAGVACHRSQCTFATNDNDGDNDEDDDNINSNRKHHTSHTTITLLMQFASTDKTFFAAAGGATGAGGRDATIQAVTFGLWVGRDVLTFPRIQHDPVMFQSLNRPWLTPFQGTYLQGGCVKE